MMGPIDLGVRRGLAALLGGIAVLIVANFALLAGILVGPVATGGAGGFMIAGLAFAIGGIVEVLVGAAMIAARPSRPAV